MKRIPIIIAALLLSSQASAQSYFFAIPEAEVTVTLERDGSALIHYELTFDCMDGAHAIDIVDIGMPNLSDHQAVSASIDGTELADHMIQVSTYLKPKGSGYEAHLGPDAISPGSRGVFTFTGMEKYMVWQDTTDPDQASFRFTPTWFGSEFVSGSTNLTLRYVLPIPAADYPEVKDRILWHKEGEEFSAKGVLEGEDVVSVAWARTVSLTGPHFFSVSFPSKYVDNVRKDNIFSAFLRWFKASTGGRILLGALLLGLFAIVFFIATRSTGWSVFLVISVILVVIMYYSPTLHLALFPVVLALGGLLIGLHVRRSRMKPRYFQAEVCLEGGGVKRGLTAVQAAVVLELPLSRVLTMVVFGLAKKGVLEVVGKNPLRVKVLGERDSDFIWKLDDRTLKLRSYEPAFLEAFRKSSGIPVHEMTLHEPVEKLLDDVSIQMVSYDLEETRSYYRHIVSRAWGQIRAEAGYEARFKRADKDLEWLMIDDGWSDSMRGLSTSGYHYHPWWYYGGSRSSFASAIPTPSDALRPATSFSDVASSVVGRMENLSQNVIQTLDGLPSTKGVDLSGVDKFTMDSLEAMFQNKGGGGGFSGGCACAGCACACACAGGGR